MQPVRHMTDNTLHTYPANRMLKKVYTKQFPIPMRRIS